MTNASTMLDLRPPRVAIDPTLHADTIDVVVEAARTARQCADACLWEPEPPRRCIALNLDAAQLCDAAAGPTAGVDPTSPAPPPHDSLSPGAAMGTSGAAPEPNEPA